METTFYISFLLTYLTFIILGYYFSEKFVKPVSITKWVLIISVTVVVGWIKLGRLVDIFNFIIQLNWCLQGFGIGIISGLLLRKFKTKIAVK